MTLSDLAKYSVTLGCLSATA